METSFSESIFLQAEKDEICGSGKGGEILDLGFILKISGKVKVGVDDDDNNDGDDDDDESKVHPIDKA